MKVVIGHVLITLLISMLGTSTMAAPIDPLHPNLPAPSKSSGVNGSNGVKKAKPRNKAKRASKTRKNHAPVDTVKQLSQEAVYGRRDYGNLDLMTYSNSAKDYRYFSPDEWDAVPVYEKSKYMPYGVVVVSYRCPPFCVALYESAVDINWREALNVAGSQLPTHEQCQAMAEYGKLINSRIEAYGGVVQTCELWGCDNFDDAYFVNMCEGYYSCCNKTHVLGVRLIWAVP